MISAINIMNGKDQFLESAKEVSKKLRDDHGIESKEHKVRKVMR